MGKCGLPSRCDSTKNQMGNGMAEVISEGVEDIVGVSEAPATEAGRVVTPTCGIVSLPKNLRDGDSQRVGDIDGDQAPDTETPVPSSHRKSVACHPESRCDFTKNQMGMGKVLK